MVMFKALNAVKLLRVSAQGELEGFDLDQHGASAYPEYVISSLTASHALGGESSTSAHIAASAEVAGAK
jgi:Amt family ammonium transporter